ncbi:palmitoleoyl-protein carboxylesterase NOTUM-like [Erinaceus europaeus]|uniref:Palmitoleoyl-protein carboxylesterase NOTUM-like n=1 Tax=Erinaceus europaeus TaxID=9365 RepID=A0ABM3WVE7_ERIEU|nr:palmitoleoyl-protein carboxylesterase NOTUM-like [Erinaceus europaeus]XP_060040545.1 palmitoleoyl-protein carboxylesterase NOTUM-like [Erinaceus europaeus]XP_060040546.1 palmitoleoyl-protein carboxylesterase NOTUM-like [Erinaceus europaeus]
MGPEVCALLLLGLLYWAGDCEAQMTWQRLGQQPHRSWAERVADDRQVVESFPLDLTALEGNMESFMEQIQSLAQALYPCASQQPSEDLHLHLLLNKSVTCNDGSPAGYYLKESKGSGRWLIFLEGGWYCFNRDTCELRHSATPHLMSSKDWPRTRIGTGILSSLPEENPHWWNANMVFIPYCSSDVWSGASPKTKKNDYAFMGTLIIQEVVRELLDRGLAGGKVLLLAGSSAGGTGVLLNVDRVAKQLEELGYPAIQVRGLVDSGWFLDNKQYRHTDCVDTLTCAPTEVIRRGIKYWNGLVPEPCRRQFKEGEEWNCFFGYKVYPTVSSPLFVVQWLFDQAQLIVDNAYLTGQPVQEDQRLYVQNLAGELRHTLQNVSASFAPACFSHEVIIRSQWTEVQVNGTSLPEALHCWDRSLHRSHNASKAPVKGCPIHLVDSCPWPHCNPTCPTIRNQFTGQEVNVAPFLRRMGFDVPSVAQ